MGLAAHHAPAARDVQESEQAKKPSLREAVAQKEHVTLHQQVQCFRLRGQQAKLFGCWLTDYFHCSGITLAACT